MSNNFSLRRAKLSDVDDIMCVMETVQSTIGIDSWFVSDDKRFVTEHVEEKGFIIIATASNGNIASFFIIRFPGEDDDNLGKHLNLSNEGLQKVAHMDSVAVLPEFRGNKLQSKMLLAAEQYLKLQNYQYLMATVHPDNTYSLHNMLKQDYEIIATVKKYGSLDRHILCKNL